MYPWALIEDSSILDQNKPQSLSKESKLRRALEDGIRSTWIIERKEVDVPLTIVKVLRSVVIKH